MKKTNKNMMNTTSNNTMKNSNTATYFICNSSTAEIIQKLFKQFS